jgi:hypothetical protein
MARASESNVRLWEVLTGKPTRSLKGHDGTVRCAAFSPDGRTLVTGGNDTTLLVWDMTRQQGQHGLKRSKELQGLEMEWCWTDLAGDEAAQAHQAIWTLVSAPRQAIPLLRERLKPVPALDRHRFEQWVADLDSEKFAVRNGATKELEAASDRARVLIQKALSGNVALETRRRLERILNNISSIPASEAVRTIRAIMVLEHIGSPDATPSSQR